MKSSKVKVKVEVKVQQDSHHTASFQSYFPVKPISHEGCAWDGNADIQLCCSCLLSALLPLRPDELYSTGNCVTVLILSKRPVCRNNARVHQRPLVATHSPWLPHTHTHHRTEKSQKRTRPRLRGAAHPLKGPPTTHHGEQELRGTPWWLLAGQPHTVQD